MRKLIVNADDLGYDPAIDRGILEAHRGGLVTSATAMVEAPFAAAALAAAPPSLAVGLHAVLDAATPPDRVASEVRRQLDLFVRLAGHAPTHLDSHKHVHAAPALAEPFARAAAAAGLPLRAIDDRHRALARAAGARTADAFLGDATLRPCWTPERLLAALDRLDDGTTELMCHPGHAPTHVRTSFGAEREVELAALTDARALRAIREREIVLGTWRTP